VCDDSSLSAERRARALAVLLSVPEKAQLMSTGGAGGGAGAGVKRLGVPGFPTGEGLHGVDADACAPDPGRTSGAACPTSFPHALALAAGFSRDEWHRVGSTISLEARALHNVGQRDRQQSAGVGLALFAPDINLFKDSRWGRGQETSGEDPALTSAYAIAFIRGLQQRDAAGKLRAIATPKHAFDYDVEGNRGRIDRGSINSNVSAQDQSRYVPATSQHTPTAALHAVAWLSLTASHLACVAGRYYWPQWRAAAQAAGAKAVMCSYPAVGGVPNCGHKEFLRGILRGKFNFSGFVVTDCGAIEDAAFFAFVERQPNASLALQAAIAMRAGVGLNCGDWYARWLPSAVSEGLVTEAELDAAFATVWSTAFELGLFEQSSFDALGARDVDTLAARELAITTGQKT
jgi:hypothetical protein